MSAGGGKVHLPDMSRDELIALVRRLNGQVKYLQQGQGASPGSMPPATAHLKEENDELRARVRSLLEQQGLLKDELAAREEEVRAVNGQIGLLSDQLVDAQARARAASEGEKAKRQGASSPEGSSAPPAAASRRDGPGTPPPQARPPAPAPRPVEGGGGAGPSSATIAALEEQVMLAQRRISELEDTLSFYTVIVAANDRAPAPVVAANSAGAGPDGLGVGPAAAPEALHADAATEREDINGAVEDLRAELQLLAADSARVRRERDALRAQLGTLDAIAAWVPTAGSPSPPRRESTHAHDAHHNGHHQHANAVHASADRHAATIVHDADWVRRAPRSSSSAPAAPPAGPSEPNTSNGGHHSTVRTSALAGVRTSAMPSFLRSLIGVPLGFKDGTGTHTKDGGDASHGGSGDDGGGGGFPRLDRRSLPEISLRPPLTAREAAMAERMKALDAYIAQLMEYDQSRRSRYAELDQNRAEMFAALNEKINTQRARLMVLEKKDKLEKVDKQGLEGGPSASLAVPTTATEGVARSQQTDVEGPPMTAFTSPSPATATPTDATIRSAGRRVATTVTCAVDVLGLQQDWLLRYTTAVLEALTVLAAEVCERPLAATQTPTPLPPKVMGEDWVQTDPAVVPADDDQRAEVERLRALLNDQQRQPTPAQPSSHQAIQTAPPPIELCADVDADDRVVQVRRLLEHWHACLPSATLSSAAPHQGPGNASAPKPPAATPAFEGMSAATAHSTAVAADFDPFDAWS